MSLHPSSKCPLPNERVVLVDNVGGREGRVECTLDRSRGEALEGMSLKEEEEG